MYETYLERPQPWAEYMLVQRIDVQNFVDEVNHRMTLGWQPHGGVAHIDGAFVQSMVR